MSSRSKIFLLDLSKVLDESLRLRQTQRNWSDLHRGISRVNEIIQRETKGWVCVALYGDQGRQWYSAWYCVAFIMHFCHHS